MIALVWLAAALARDVSLEEAVRLAQQANPELRVARLEAEVARAKKGEVRSWLLPTVSTEAALLWWDSPLEVTFVEGDPCADLADAFQEICAGMVGDFTEPMVLREKGTQYLSFSATQPLSGLYGISQGVRATQAMEDAAQAQARAKEADVVLDVVDTWYTALETQQLLELAEQAVETLAAHERRVQAFYEAELIGREDVLRLDVARADAENGLRLAKMGVALSRRKLALVTGADDDSLTPVGEAVVPPEAMPDLGDPEQLTLGHADVVAMRAQLAAARAEHNRLRADVIPQVAGVGKWTKNWGVGSFAAEEEWYVGLGLDWDIWTWGRRHYATQEAALHVAQAEEGLAALQRGALLQAEAALMQAEVAIEAYADSEATLAQATEHLRIITVKHEAGAVATTDLLEAEVLAQQARVQRVQLGVDAMVALARARHALGLPVGG